MTGTGAAGSPVASGPTTQATNEATVKVMPLEVEMKNAEVEKDGEVARKIDQSHWGPYDEARIFQVRFLINSKFTYSYGFSKTPTGENDVYLEWKIKYSDLF